MFDSPFVFKKINHVTKLMNDAESVVTHNYCFRGKLNKRYIVQVEEYRFHVFVIKFFLADHRNDHDRYNKATRLYECSRVIATICQIMKSIFQGNPFCSFGFVGSNLPDESVQNTKRFRLYSKVVGLIISVVEFEHHQSINDSAYLLLNRHHKDPDLIDKILGVFTTIYGDDIFAI